MAHINTDDLITKSKPSKYRGVYEIHHTDRTVSMALIPVTQAVVPLPPDLRDINELAQICVRRPQIYKSDQWEKLFQLCLFQVACENQGHNIMLVGPVPLNGKPGLEIHINQYTDSQLEEWFHGADGTVFQPDELAGFSRKIRGGR